MAQVQGNVEDSLVVSGRIQHISPEQLQEKLKKPPNPIKNARYEYYYGKLQQGPALIITWAFSLLPFINLPDGLRVLHRFLHHPDWTIDSLGGKICKACNDFHFGKTPNSEQRYDVLEKEEQAEDDEAELFFKSPKRSLKNFDAGQILDVIAVYEASNGKQQFRYVEVSWKTCTIFQSDFYQYTPICRDLLSRTFNEEKAKYDRENGHLRRPRRARENLSLPRKRQRRQSKQPEAQPVVGQVEAEQHVEEVQQQVTESIESLKTSSSSNELEKDQEVANNQETPVYEQIKETNEPLEEAPVLLHENAIDSEPQQQPSSAITERADSPINMVDLFVSSDESAAHQQQELASSSSSSNLVNVPPAETAATELNTSATSSSSSEDWWFNSIEPTTSKANSSAAKQVDNSNLFDLFNNINTAEDNVAMNYFNDPLGLSASGGQASTHFSPADSAYESPGLGLGGGLLSSIGSDSSANLLRDVDQLINMPPSTGLFDTSLFGDDPNQHLDLAGSEFNNSGELEQLILGSSAASAPPPQPLPIAEAEAVPVDYMLFDAVHLGAPERGPQQVAISAEDTRYLRQERGELLLLDGSSNESNAGGDQQQLQGDFIHQLPNEWDINFNFY